MANRVFVCAVVLLWLGSMSWLLVDKVLPSFRDGEPPISGGYETNVPVAWEVFWGGRSVGHAASVRTPGVLGTTNVDSRVVLENVPLLDLVPALMRHVVGDIGAMKFDASTKLEFDSLDNFSKFTSRVGVNDVPGVLVMTGRMHGSFLELKVEFGGSVYTPKMPVSDQAGLSEALFPDAVLPYLYVGRQWQEEVYNPFRSPRAPVETVDVEVVGIESFAFAGKQQRAMRVEFRGPPGPGISEESRLQAIAWVRADDGLVLQQDVLIANSHLRFQRLSKEAAAVAGDHLLTRRDEPGYGRYDGGKRAWGE